MASRSAIDPPRWSYDVFLSFRGEDTRNTFAGHLYNALRDKGINAFLDDDLIRKGEEISPAISKAIQESRISIIRFSKNYASSTWCLEELAQILECQKSKGQIVCPVFYYLEPSQVRKITGTFQEAFTVHKDKLKGSANTMQRWKEALYQAANMSGWHLENRKESDMIKTIVEEVSRKLKRTFLNVAKYPVQMDNHLHEMNLLLSIKSYDVRPVGIHGIGGIGKTTIAKAVYNLIADQYEGCGFLSNIGATAKQQQGLVQLQEMLLREILGNINIEVSNVDEGIVLIRERLCCKRVLVVLDNVDDVEQLETLAGDCDWFGLGSRIIVTTRDEHVLVAHGVRSKYRVKSLNDVDALQLLSWHAFKKPHPSKVYEELSHCVVKYCKGLPLALTVLGSFLCGRSAPEWKSVLDKLKKVPNKKIYDILKVSFDGLDEEEKDIFLDIACFFVGKEKDYVMEILEGCNFSPVIGTQVLLEKSMIYIENDKMQMHDMLQLMGREIVRQESPKEPGKRSRLWHYEDVLRVLTENTGTDETEAILIDVPKSEELWFTNEAFSKMKRLRLLMVRNADNVVGQGFQCTLKELRCLDWHGYPLATMLPNFLSRNLVSLYLSDSKIERLDFGSKKFENMKNLDFTNCRYLTNIPDVSAIPNLEKLILRDCTGLSTVHQSVGFLDRLVLLDFYSCSNLKFLPSSFKLKSLQRLILSHCSRLTEFPEILEEMQCLRQVDLDETAIRRLPESIEYLTGLRLLRLMSCRNLIKLPGSTFRLQSLKILDVSYCTQLREIPQLLQFSCESLENCPEFKGIDVCNTARFLMPNVRDFISCHQLVSTSGNKLANVLLTQGLLQQRRIQIGVPGSEYPPWFSLHSESSSLSFQLPLNLVEKVIGLAVYAGFELEKKQVSDKFECGFEVIINGVKINTWSSAVIFDNDFEHMWLFYCPCSWSGVVQHRKQLVDILIKFEIYPDDQEETEVKLKRCGVHLACKHQDQDDVGTDPTMFKYIFPPLASVPHGKQDASDSEKETEKIAQSGKEQR